jgi:hypothetical protein
MIKAMVTLIFVVGGGNVAVAQSTPADPSAVTADAAAPADKSADKPAEKKVCRSDAPLGSRIAKRTCHLPSEWAAIDQQRREALEVAKHEGYRNR